MLTMPADTFTWMAACLVIMILIIWEGDRIE